MKNKNLPVIGSMVASATLLIILLLLLRGMPAQVAFTAESRISMADFGEIQMSPGGTKKGEPGTVVTFAHGLTNTYLGRSVAITLTSDSSQGWEVDHVPTTTLGARLNGTLVISVSVPSVIGEPVGQTTITDVTTITATWKATEGGLAVVTATDTTVVEKPIYNAQLPLVVRAHIPTWSRGGLAGNTVYQIAVCGADPSQVYAGAETGVFRSRDAGASWQATNLRGVRVRGLDVAADDCDEVYAATWGQYVKRSKSGGDSWETLSEGLPSPYLYTVVVRDQPPFGPYAGTAEDGVYQYLDTGIGGSWTQIPDTEELIVARLTLAKSGDLLVATWGSNGYRLSFETVRWKAYPLNVLEDNLFEVVQAGNGDLFAATDDHLYRSTGQEWTEVHDQRTYGVAPDPDQAEVVYAATEDGAWRSTDGGEIFSRFGLDDVTVRDVAPGPEGSTLLHAGTTEGAWRRSRQ